MFTINTLCLCGLGKDHHLVKCNAQLTFKKAEWGGGYEEGGGGGGGGGGLKRVTMQHFTVG